MHKYPFHVGDYRSDTPHLTMQEHGAYRLLLDFCYSSEAPLPNDMEFLYRICVAFKKKEQESVQKVLNYFFKKEENGWEQKRVSAEIACFKRLSEQGKKGLEKRWENLSNSQTDSQRNSQTDSQSTSQTDSFADSLGISQTNSRMDSQTNSRNGSRMDSQTNSRNGSQSTSQLANSNQEPVTNREDIAKAISSHAPNDAKASWSEQQQEWMIPEHVMQRFTEAYPACNIREQALRAGEWLIANPAKRKKDTHRFLCNWLARAQERGGDLPKGVQGYQRAIPQATALDIAAQRPAVIPEPLGWRDAMLGVADDPDTVPQRWIDLPLSLQKYALELCEKEAV